ncbi:MAG: class I SAM-dependent methyltransferase [Myxococcales bacterium]|nr:class I SAM-dependent methyltransferase [Myxococcales bacterium]
MADAAGDALFRDRWTARAGLIRGPVGRLRARIRHPKLHVIERGLRRFLAGAGAGAGERPIEVHEHGCGSGQNLHILRQLLGGTGGRVRFSGSDISPRAVELANQQGGGGGPIPVVVDDCQASSLPAASYDVVVSADLLGHLPRLEEAVDHIARILRSGGWYITFTETDGYRDDPGAWRHPIVQAAGVDPWIAKDLHVNLKPAATIEAIFHARGFRTIERHANLDGGRLMAALGCKDVTEMVARTGLRPDAYLRRCMIAERLSRASGLKYGLVLGHRLAKLLTGDRGGADRGGYYFIFERVG